MKTSFRRKSSHSHNSSHSEQHQDSEEGAESEGEGSSSSPRFSGPRRRVISLGHFQYRPREIASAVPPSPPRSVRRRTTSHSSSLDTPRPYPSITLTLATDKEDSSVSDSTSVRSAPFPKLFQPLSEPTLEPVMSLPDIPAATDAQPQDSPDELMAPASPPVVEQDVLDPFLVDDPDDPVTPSEPPTARPLSVGLSLDDAQIPPAAADVISLVTDPLPVPSPSLDVHKPIPPPPASDSDESEAEAPVVYVPELVLPTMFLPIPLSVRVRPCSLLTWWYTKRATALYSY